MKGKYAKEYSNLKKMENKVLKSEKNGWIMLSDFK